MKETKNPEKILPPNILLKLSWVSTLKLLNNKDRGIVLMNFYNFHTGEEIIPMSKAAQMFFCNAVDVFEYNIGEYQRRVEANRENGPKGGRPKKDKKDSPPVLQKNSNNSDGFSIIPNIPKEKDKAIDIVKSIDTDNDIETEIAAGRIKETDPRFEKYYMKKFAALLQLKYNDYSDPDEKKYIFYANLFHEKLGPEIFSKLIFAPELLDIPSLANEHKLVSSIAEAGFIRKHMIHYLGKLVK